MQKARNRSFLLQSHWLTYGGQAILPDYGQTDATAKKILTNRILELDPTGDLVTLSPNPTNTGGSIRYNESSGLVSYEKIKRLTDEEYVRAYLIVRLVKQLRYPAGGIELEKKYTIGRPTGKSAQLDVRVLDTRRETKTFLLIEAKSPDEFGSYGALIEDQLFAPGNMEARAGVRYLAWYTVEFLGSGLRDKCIVIDFDKHHTYKAWVKEGEPSHDLELPVEYGVVRKQRYIKGESPLRTDVTKAELETLRKDFHNVLWGGAKMGDTDVFNNLLKMFLAKIYDEQITDAGKPYRFQIELRDGEPESSSAVLGKVNRLYQEALKYYFAYSADTIAASSINVNRFPPNKVTYVVERLESISVIENEFEDDVLGVFFESIVRTGFKQEKGQFFTHTNIVRFMLYALGLDLWAINLINSSSPALPYIVDPSCGSGTFLIEAMKLVTQSVLHTNKNRLKGSIAVRSFVDEYLLPDASNKNSHNRWARTFVYGIDDNEDLAAATKVNMILHGDGNANILKADGLAEFDKYGRPLLKVSRADLNGPYKLPVNEQFDAVLSNPPFSLKEEARTLAEYGLRFAYAEQKNSENLFVERWYQLLREGGRLGVVLPDSVFDTNENLYIRMFLYRFFWIRAVVSLPQITFQPYTPTKTSLLFAVKKTHKEVEAWDAAWRAATNQYAGLRKSGIVQYLILNERVRKALIDLAAKAGVEWYPSANLLSAPALPSDIRRKIGMASPRGSGQRKRFARTIREFRALLATNPLVGLSSEHTKAAILTLTRLLRDRVPPKANALDLLQFIEASYDDLLQATELNYTEDPSSQDYCNAWWCFAEVTSLEPFDYKIFFAEAEHVGYKRTTRHPEGIPQPNDLFQTDEDGSVVIDTKRPRRILDHLRSETLFDGSNR
jgi:type I restriction enzyme M protein